MPAQNHAASPAAPVKELWSIADLVAAGLGSRTTIWRVSKSDPTFPRPVRVGTYPKWRPSDIRDWLESRRESSAA